MEDEKDPGVWIQRWKKQLSGVGNRGRFVGAYILPNILFKG